MTLIVSTNRSCLDDSYGNEIFLIDSEDWKLIKSLFTPSSYYNEYKSKTFYEYFLHRDHSIDIKDIIENYKIIDDNPSKPSKKFVTKMDQRTIITIIYEHIFNNPILIIEYVEKLYFPSNIGKLYEAQYYDLKDFIKKHNKEDIINGKELFVNFIKCVKDEYDKVLKEYDQ